MLASPPALSPADKQDRPEPASGLRSGELPPWAGGGGSTPLAARRFGESGPTLHEVGERSLLNALVEQSRRTLAGGPPLAVPSGDDAAVIAPPPGRALVVTQDALVEGVDFRPGWMTPHQLGRRVLTVSLSDLAATGSAPAFCLLTICARPSTLALDVLAIAAGVCDLAVETGCSVAGGDLSAIDGPLVLDLMAAGFVAPDRTLRRDAGRPGDLLVVTGVLGRAAAGLAALQGRLGLAAHRSWIDAQLDPRARLAEGMALADAGVRCAGDLSDGLWLDAERTAIASRCGAELWWDAVPVDRELGALPAAERQRLALAGGEDFELLAAASPRVVTRLQQGWPARLTPLSVVGRLTRDPGICLLDSRAGQPLEPPRPTSLHFD
jgi:thiamine-monophosphate kinase